MGYYITYNKVNEEYGLDRKQYKAMINDMLEKGLLKRERNGNIRQTGLKAYQKNLEHIKENIHEYSKKEVKKNMYLGKGKLEELTGILPDKYEILADELEANDIVKRAKDGTINVMSPEQYKRAIEYAQRNAERINEETMRRKVEKKSEFPLHVKQEIALLNGTMNALEDEIRRKIGSEEAIQSMISKILAVTQVSLGIGIESAKCGMDWQIISNIQQMRGS